MSSCPTCADRVASYPPREQAMIPLRHAAHEFASAWNAYFDAVRGRAGNLADLEAKGNAADAALAAAALEYARRIAEIDAEEARP